MIIHGELEGVVGLNGADWALINLDIGKIIALTAGEVTLLLADGTTASAAIGPNSTVDASLAVGEVAELLTDPATGEAVSLAPPPRGPPHGPDANRATLTAFNATDNSTSTITVVVGRLISLSGGPAAAPGGGAPAPAPAAGGPPPNATLVFCSNGETSTVTLTAPPPHGPPGPGRDGRGPRHGDDDRDGGAASGPRPGPHRPGCGPRAGGLIMVTTDARGTSMAPARHIDPAAAGLACGSTPAPAPAPDAGCDHDGDDGPDGPHGGPRDGPDFGDDDAARDRADEMDGPGGAAALEAAPQAGGSVGAVTV